MSDGIHSVPSYEVMSPSAKKIRDFYAGKPGAPIYQQEFWWFTLEKWAKEGHLLPESSFENSEAFNAHLREVFMLDEPAENNINNLGWCEAGFYPAFKEIVLEDRGDYELVQDSAGRGVLFFKGRRNGFMPEYVTHPVRDWTTWEENVKWRLMADTPGREQMGRDDLEKAVRDAVKGNVIVQRVVGGYMYLRSLMGPEDVMYLLYDEPELIHDCMKTWFELADKVTAENQKVVSLDEFYIGEDICYKGGSLISPEMIKEFLFPYYEQLYTNIKKRNMDRDRKVFFHLDTDGNCYPVIDLYRAIGVDYISPFEVASGCDVVETGKKYPDLLMLGGFDKRIMAAGTEAIDRELERIMPVMRRRGGYLPTCDHGVPEEVSFENYMYYRKRMLEYCK